ncbi:hypothetical protein TNCV_5038491 [Trichonephila clavipes]|nr:hypothetical protein TNCV_5038491 [Trichonephila clavipes]
MVNTDFSDHSQSFGNFGEILRRTLIGTQTVSGSPQFGFRLPSRSPYRFNLSLNGPHKGSLKNPIFPLKKLHNGSL